MKSPVLSDGVHSDLDPILVSLVDEFSRRVENGETIDVEEFAVLHPAHAERLRALLPAIRVLAALGRSGAAGGVFAGDLREGSRGGMGVVYEAFQMSLNRAVALKVLSRRSGADFLERFRREAQVVARLQHTNIVPVFGIGEDQGIHFFAMRFIHGHSLDRLLRGLRRAEQATTRSDFQAADEATEEIVRFAQEPAISGAVRGEDLRMPGTAAYYRAVAAVGVQVARGLAYAHGLGVLHRDVKPSNLLLDGSGIVHLTDFGLAKVQGDESLTHTGDMVGTLRYMAPERFEGRCDVLSDVYGLGITLYELLTLRPAYDEPERAQLLERIRHGTLPPPSAVAANVPRDLETIVLMAIDPAPASRYQTATALGDDLCRYLENRPIMARSPSWWDLAQKWTRRYPAITALGAALLLTIGTLLAVWVDYSLNLQRAVHDKDGALLEKNGALVEKHHQWEQAEIARKTAESGEYHALLDEAQARRLAGRAGWRHHALANLETLAHSNAPDKDVLALRTEAVACLTAADLHRETSFPVDDILSLAFSPDGRKLAILGINGKVVLWDMQTLKPLDTIPPDNGKRSEAARSTIQFHPSGRYFAFAERNGVRVVPLTASEMVFPRLDLPVEVLHLGFSCSGDRLAVVRADHRVTLYAVPSGLPIRTVEVKEWNSEAIALSPEADRLAVADARHNIVLYSLDAPGDVTVLGQHQAEVTDLAFTPDGNKAVSASLDGTVRMWNAALSGGPQTRVELWTIPPGTRHRLALSKDGRFLLLVDTVPMGAITLRETIGGSSPLVTSFLEVARAYTFSGDVAFSPAGDQVVVGRQSRRGRKDGLPPMLDIFRVEGAREKRRLVGMPGPVRTLAFHPCRALAVTAGQFPERNLTFWDLERCCPARLWDDQTAGLATPLAFSPDGTLLATSLAGKANELETLGIRDMDTGAVRHRVPGLSRLSFVEFSHTGKMLVTDTPFMQPWGHIIPLADKQPLLTPLPGWEPSNGGRRIRFDGDDRVVTLSFAGQAEVYDSTTGVPLRQVNLMDLYRNQLSGDGRLMLGFSGARKRILLYQFPEMRELAATLPENPEETLHFTGHPFSVDNHYVVTIGNLQAPQLRDGRTLELLCTFPSPNRVVADLIFSPHELLAVLEAGTSCVMLYDIQEIRRRLAERGLDWSDRRE